MTNPVEKSTHAGQYEVVKPTLKDIPQLLDLWRKQYEYHHNLDALYYSPYSDEMRTPVEMYLRELIADEQESHVFVAKEGTNLVGFITFGIGTDSYFDTNIKRFGEIKELFVTLDTRGQGVGKTLIDKVEDTFREKNITYVKVQVSAFNTTAIAVYEKLGYQTRQQQMYKDLSPAA